jgi:hypothetical protein
MRLSRQPLGIIGENMAIIYTIVFSAVFLPPIIYYIIKSVMLLSNPYKLLRITNNEKWKYTIVFASPNIYSLLTLLMIILLLNIPGKILYIILVTIIPIILWFIILIRINIEWHIFIYKEIDKIIKTNHSSMLWLYKNYIYLWISEEYRKFIKEGY